MTSSDSPSGPSNPSRQRERVRAIWDGFAPLYDRYMLPTARPVAERLVELLDPPVAARVLDLATGTGTAAIAAAQRVGPEGRVTGIDLSPAILDIARRHVADAGLANLDIKEMSAEDLELPAESFDAILCGLGLMFFSEPDRALAEAWRVAKPGAKVALSVWGAPEGMWMSNVVAAMQPQLPTRGPQGPGPFTFATDEALGGALRQTRFTLLKLERSDWPTVLPSAEVAWDVVRWGGPLALNYASMPQATQHALHDAVLAALAPFAGGSGVLTLPFEVLFALAEKPA